VRGCGVTLPASGMRKGSVQNTLLRASARSDAFTATVSSMGSSGGMTAQRGAALAPSVQATLSDAARSGQPCLAAGQLGSSSSLSVQAALVPAGCHRHPPEVRIMMQLRMSLKRSRSGSCNKGAAAS
jgi:hypothetical protein